MFGVSFSFYYLFWLKLNGKPSPGSVWKQKLLLKSSISVHMNWSEGLLGSKESDVSHILNIFFSFFYS